jgi:hypothetical protein
LGSAERVPAVHHPQAHPTGKGHFVRSTYQELTLRSALSDPLIRTVMAADNVDPAKLEAMLQRIAEKVALRQSQPMEAHCACQV